MELVYVCVCVCASIFAQFDSELKALIVNFNSVMIENNTWRIIESRKSVYQLHRLVSRYISEWVKI